jgi:hypothetical protein
LHLSASVKVVEPERQGTEAVRRKGGRMPSCFVIQPFDKGPFDKRFEDVIEPAIRAADLEAYRVDRDPGASIPIEDMEAGIRSAAVCLADITTDNPNVWFELGFAISSGKDVVLVSAASRERFPFDIHHRKVLVYSTDSTSDFEGLRARITKRIKAILTKEEKIGGAAQVASPVAPVEGLASHELVALVTVGQNLDSPGDSVSAYLLRKDMEKAGFTRIAVTLSLASLLAKNLLVLRDLYDEQTHESYTAYALTESGLKWLVDNQDKLVLKSEDMPF